MVLCKKKNIHIYIILLSFLSYAHLTNCAHSDVNCVEVLDY